MKFKEGLSFLFKIDKFSPFCICYKVVDFDENMIRVNAMLLYFA